MQNNSQKAGVCGWLEAAKNDAALSCRLCPEAFLTSVLKIHIWIHFMGNQEVPTLGLGVVKHTTAWNWHLGGDETLK